MLGWDRAQGGGAHARDHLHLRIWDREGLRGECLALGVFGGKCQQASACDLTGVGECGGGAGALCEIAALVHTHGDAGVQCGDAHIKRGCQAIKQVGALNAWRSWRGVGAASAAAQQSADG